MGHFGAAPLTTIFDFPLVQVIDFATDLLAEDMATKGAGIVAGTGTTTGAGFSWVIFTLTVGEEKVKPPAESLIHPSLSLMSVVAI